MKNRSSEKRQYPAFLEGEESEILAVIHRAIVEHAITVDDILTLIRRAAKARDRGQSPTWPIGGVKKITVLGIG